MDTKHSGNPGSRRQRGLTLIETATVLAVMAVVAASAAPGLADFIDARRLDGAATRLEADIRFVRSEARARNGRCGSPSRRRRTAAAGSSTPACRRSACAPMPGLPSAAAAPPRSGRWSCRPASGCG